ncbi:hypothetical protein [Pseudotabrizicola formosa]|uniref:hypothetical protein n=1 Tax=Pseudotabrizicola formosa TaxID=2030009 RepID=UPI000CD0D848|nr:hypothetical protein [Pseudotabrizicola formosa]
MNIEMLTAIVVFGLLLAIALVGLTMSIRETNQRADTLRPRDMQGVQGEYGTQSQLGMGRAPAVAPEDPRAAKAPIPPIPS